MTKGPFSLQKTRDMKTRDDSHCMSSLLRKLAKFLEELRMPNLLVQPFPACYSVRVKAAQKEIRGM